MVRAFQTTTVRAQRELTNQLWEFEAKKEKRMVALPSCVESYPGYENYRGKAVFRTKFQVPPEIRRNVAALF